MLCSSDRGPGAVNVLSRRIPALYKRHHSNSHSHGRHPKHSSLVKIFTNTQRHQSFITPRISSLISSSVRFNHVLDLKLSIKFFIQRHFVSLPPIVLSYQSEENIIRASLSSGERDTLWCHKTARSSGL